MKKEDKIKLKIDESLLDYSKELAWNVYRQYGIDLETYKGEPLNVMSFYMPEEEQDKIAELVTRKGKLYKRYSRTYIKRALPYSRLDYFPTSSMECFERENSDNQPS